MATTLVGALPETVVREALRIELMQTFEFKILVRECRDVY